MFAVIRGPIVSVVVCAAMVGACASQSPRLRQAQALMARGDFAGAERVAGDALKASPNEAPLRRLRMAAALRQREHARAVELYVQWHHQRHRYDTRAITSLALGTLRNALASPDERVRLQGLSASRGARSALAPDIQRLLVDSDARVRVSAASARYRASARARAVVRRALTATDAAVRVRALGALAQARTGPGRAAARKLAVAALTSRNPSVRRAAATVLVRVGGANDVLMAVAARDKAGPVRAAAISGISARGERSLEIAIAALSDDYLGARLAALRILAAHGARGREALAALVTGSDSYVGLRAAVALRKSGEPGLAATDRLLVRALGDRRWPLRVAALNAVVELSSPEAALRLLGNALVDNRPEVRLAAARDLARLGATGRASATFYSALDSPEAAVRVQAAEALMRMQDSGGNAALARLLRAARSSTRAAAARALAYADAPTLALVKALADDAAEVRIAAAGSLLRLMN